MEQSSDSSFLQPVPWTLRPVSGDIMGALQRMLKLRAVLGRHQSLCWNFPSRALKQQSGLLVGPSWQCEVGSKRLHTEADRPKPSPAAAPDRRPFSRITEEDLAFFRNILPGRVVTDPDLLESNNEDWLKSVRGDNSCSPFLKPSEKF